MGFAKPIEQYLFSNLLIRIHVFMYLKDIIRDKDYCECGMPIENKSINVFRASRNRKKHPVTINVST